MYLRLCGTCANSAPADQICNVLRADHIQKLGTSGEAKCINLRQQLARNTQTIVDAEAVIKIRIVDETFPAYGGAWFFKINAHDDFEIVLETLALFNQTVCILHTGLGIVNRARPDHYHQTIILTMQNAVQCGPRIRCHRRNFFVTRKFTKQMRWGRQFFQFSDPQIISAWHGFSRCVSGIKTKTAIAGGFKDSVSVLLCRELTASPPPKGWGS